MAATNVMLVGKGGDAPRNAPSSGHTGKTIFQMILFYVLSIGFMAAHLALILHLNNRAVANTRIPQSIATALGNFLALIAELMLMSGLAVAYEQILWRQFQQKSLASFVRETLVGLPGAPWHLIKLQVIRMAWLPWLISLGCIMMPLAGMFPPGTLTIEFRNSVVPSTHPHVPTMNISDWGFGDFNALMEHSLFDMDADLNWLTPLNRLERLAGTVLAIGRPIEPPTPCEGPCSYALDIHGPRFHCEEAVGRNVSLFEPCQGLSLDRVFSAEMWDLGLDKTPSNNSFTFSSYHGRNYTGECEDSTLKTYVCHTTLAQYHVEIANAANGTTNYTTEIRDDVDFWNSREDINTSFYDYYLHSVESGIRTSPINQTQLAAQFINLQAYTIAYTAMKAIAGNVTRYEDRPAVGYGAYSYRVQDTLVVGSPYFGMEDRFNPTDDFSPELFQEYLQDLIISTISLNDREKPQWTTWAEIDTLEGGEVFVFLAKRQFYAPYGACLATAFLIYLVGIYSLVKNGGPADSSIPQYAIVASDDTPMRSDDEESRSMEKRVDTDMTLRDYGAR